jgi:hypothetical protein
MTTQQTGQPSKSKKHAHELNTGNCVTQKTRTHQCVLYLFTSQELLRGFAI